MSTQGLASQLSGLRMMSLRDVAAELPEPNSLRFARAPPGFARAPVAPPTALGQEVQRNQTGAMPILGLAPGQRLVRRVAQYDMRQLDPSLGFKIVAPGALEEPFGLGAAPPMICTAGWQTAPVHSRLDLHGQDLHGRLAPVLARPATLGPFTVPPTASLGPEVAQGQTASGAMPTQTPAGLGPFSPVTHPVLASLGQEVTQDQTAAMPTQTQKRKMPTQYDMGVHERERYDMAHFEVYDPLRLDKDAAYMRGPAEKFHDAWKKEPEPAAERVEEDIFADLVAGCDISQRLSDCDISGRSEEFEETDETGLRMPWGVEPVLSRTMEQCQPEKIPEGCPGLLSHHGSGLTDDGVC